MASSSSITLPVLEGDEARNIDLEVTEKLGRVRVLESVANRIADALQYHILDHRKGHPMLFVGGKGNNGANVIAAARILHLRGVDVRVVALVNDDGQQRPNIQEQLDLFEVFVGKERLSYAAADPTLQAVKDFGGILIDGILGTGIADPPRGIARDAIRAVNDAKHAKGVVSIDIPSGLNHVTGETPGDCVKATWTLNLHMLKQGQLTEIAKPYVGELWSAESNLGFITFTGYEEAFREFYKESPIVKVDLRL